jgi:hypothetical protein
MVQPLLTKAKLYASGKNGVHCRKEKQMFGCPAQEKDKFSGELQFAGTLEIAQRTRP